MAERLSTNSVTQCGGFELATPLIWSELSKAIKTEEWKVIGGRDHIHVTTEVVVMVEEPAGPAATMMKDLVEILVREDDSKKEKPKDQNQSSVSLPKIGPIIPIWAAMTRHGIPQVVQVMIDIQLRTIHKLC